MTGVPPRIAVLIVSWNSADHLGRTLAAVAAQTFAPARVVVLDNASRDASVDIARAAGAEVIASPRNTGFAEGNNLAAAAVPDCDWLAFLNPDAFPDPHWLQRIAEAIATHPDVAMFASELRLDDDPRRLDGAGDAYHVSGLAWRIGHTEPASDDPTVREVFSPCGAAAIVRRDAFSAVGGFDPAFFCYAEDVDLGFRLRLAGHRCLYVPGALVRHIGSAATGRRSTFATYHGHRNLVWVWVKNMPAGTLWRYAPQHLLLTVASLVRFALAGQGLTLLRAKWDALRALPRVLAQRRALQMSRRAATAALLQPMARGWLTPYLAHRRRQRPDA